MRVPQVWVYAHAAPLDGDHTTALSGTLWRRALGLVLARAGFVGRGRLAACVVRSIQGELGSSLDTGANTHTHMRRTQFGDVGCSYDLTMAQTCLIMLGPRVPKLFSRHGFGSLFGVGRLERRFAMARNMAGTYFNNCKFGMHGPSGR